MLRMSSNTRNTHCSKLKVKINVILFGNTHFYIFKDSEKNLIRI